MVDDDASTDDARPMREMHRLAGTNCHRCRSLITHRQALASVALGLMGSPRCTPCLADGLGKPVDALRQDVVDFMRRRDCFGRAWLEAESLDQSCEPWPRWSRTDEMARTTSRSPSPDLVCRTDEPRLLLERVAPGTIVAIGPVDVSIAALVHRCREVGLDVLATNESMAQVRVTRSAIDATAGSSPID